MDAGDVRWQGLSPRVRGNPDPIQHPNQEHGSIPASAGKPTMASLALGTSRVYPRECGETDINLSSTGTVKGLSPRVRGNRQGEQETAQRRGSIPASAGKPRRARSSSPSTRVYPRECGETPDLLRGSEATWGLSPRVRGNPPRPTSGTNSWRSIPASAGKPPWPRLVAFSCRVYPRECGET